MAKSPSALPHVAIVGAGAFGGWTALELARRGCQVTLLDAWGPGHARASSGGETRVIRTFYGSDPLYAEWTARAFGRWQEAEAAWGQRLYEPLGCLWLFRGDDTYARTSLPVLAALGLPAEELAPRQVPERFPGVTATHVQSAFFEPQAGALYARRACRAVAAAVTATGATLELTHAQLGETRGGQLLSLARGAGAALAADAFVFACGPWLPKLFPELLGTALRPTRQEVFFFGTPAGDRRFAPGALPVWIDFAERIFYGIPGNEGRGFKVADDTRGGAIDPDTAERLTHPEPLARARALLADRFPDLTAAPLVETRVCQYENSPDGHLIVDRHPEFHNVWIAGGGSGHGFKLAPVLGEELASWLLRDERPPAALRLGRWQGHEDVTARSQFARGSEGGSSVNSGL